MDTLTVKPSQVKSVALRAMLANRPLFIWGPPGIGKSDIVKQLGEEQNRPVRDIRLSLWEPTDIKGVPFYNPTANTMCWAPPSELPSDPDDNSILFLDELNSAAQATQAAAYQLILNRRVGTYVLPKNVSIVAAGNRDGDKGVTYRMPSPLANRFVHLEVRPDFESWQTWAVKNKIHADVVGYLSFAKSDMFDFDPRSNSRSFATPRSWTFASDFCKDSDMPASELTDLVAGCVGEGIAHKFMAHRKVAGSLPKPEDILAGKVKELKTKEVSAMYSLTTSMCYELQDFYTKNKDKVPEFHKMADNFLRFMMDNFTTEVTVMGARVALTTYNLPMVPGKMPSFDEFHQRYGKYVLAAAGSSK